MKTGIVSGAYLVRYGDREGAERMRRHGYDCVDFGELCDTTNELYAMTVRELDAALTEKRKILEASGISVSQTHGPWRCPITDATENDRLERFEKMSRALYASSVLGAPYMVIHPIMPTGGADRDHDLTRQANADFFGNLVEVARASGTVICLENMPFLCQIYSKPVDTLGLVKQINSPYFKMCLDTGHSQVWKVSPADAARMIGRDLLCTLHVHDNDGKHDSHILPGEGVIDWEDFRRALKEIGFEGSLSLENKVPPPVSEEAERKLADMAAWLAGKREERPQKFSTGF